MSKIKKNTLKAVQNRNRVNFHRRWRSILNHENQSTHDVTDNQSQSSAQNNPNQANENIGSKECLQR